MVKRKPDLFLDVDGVINVFAEGYQNRAVEVDGDKFPHLLYPSEHTLPFMRWAWTVFDVYWCTAWGEQANRIADWAKLPQRPCVADVRSSNAEWKLDGVKAFMKGKRGAALWVEDGIGPVADAWVGRKKNFFYIHTNFRVGVTRNHAACLADALKLPMEAWK
jgi:hypothetical protein